MRVSVLNHIPFTHLDFIEIRRPEVLEYKPVTCIYIQILFILLCSITMSSSENSIYTLQISFGANDVECQPA